MVYIILNDKDSFNWLWSTWGLFCFLTYRSIQYSSCFKLLLFFPCCHHLLWLSSGGYLLLQPLMELVKVTQENSTYKTADILADDQLQPPLDMVNFTQDPQPKNRSEWGGIHSTFSMLACLHRQIIN